jgi:peptidoglycan/xylan/chitin deacetylase (PgdA/CDA1 family)
MRKVRAGLLVIAVLIIAASTLSGRPSRSAPLPPPTASEPLFPADQAPETPHPSPVLSATPTPASSPTPIVAPVIYHATHPLVLTPSAIAPLIDHVHVTQPVVFITIDDGFIRDPRVPPLIKRLGLPVSLFLIPRPAVQGETYFRSIVRSGSVVEDHTEHHPNLTELAYLAQRAEICTPIARITTMFGRRPTLLRPPGGAWNPDTLRAASDCGLGAVVTWDAVLSNGKLSTIGGLKPGDIILIHFRPALYSDLILLMHVLRARHLGVGLLEDYVRFAGPTPTPSPSFSASPSPTPSSSPTPTPTATAGAVMPEEPTIQ